MFTDYYNNCHVLITIKLMSKFQTLMTAISLATEIRVRRATKKIIPKKEDVNSEIPTYNLLRVL